MTTTFLSCVLHLKASTKQACFTPRPGRWSNTFSNATVFSLDTSFIISSPALEWIAFLQGLQKIKISWTRSDLSSIMLSTLETYSNTLTFIDLLYKLHGFGYMHEFPLTVSCDSWMVCKTRTIFDESVLLSRSYLLFPFKRFSSFKNSMKISFGQYMISPPTGTCCRFIWRRLHHS